MKCLFCAQQHAETYICAKRCEARVATILSVSLKIEKGNKLSLLNFEMS